MRVGFVTRSGFGFACALISFYGATLVSGCGGSSNPISVTVTSSKAIVDATDTATLTASVANDKNSAGVTWTVSGGGTLSNTTSSSATYTAPAASSSSLSVTITATSVADGTKSASTTLTVPPAPTITTASLTPGAVGTQYSVALAGSGGIPPYTFTVSSGTLPACLTISSAGVISGTPTASCAGSSNLTFQVTDSGTPNALTATSAALDLTITAAPAIVLPAPATLTAATYDVAYTGSVEATAGGAGALTYSITSGALPTGLSLNPSTGAITGTPSAVGTFAFTIKAADAFGDSATQAYSIKASYPAVTVTAATLPVGYVGSNYPQTTLTATGGSGTGFTWALASGSLLPAGLNLSAAGVITGRPTAAGGPTSFTVDVTDSASNTGTGTFAITIDAGVSITTASPLPAGFVGSPYPSTTLAARGGTGTGYTWSWAAASGSSIPAGLSLSAGGAISGTPTAAGTSSVVVTVTDSAQNSTSATFSITIDAGISITTSATLPTAFANTLYTTTLAATGGSGTGYAWTVASGSSLPAWLSLSPAGVLSGTPTSAATDTFTLKVTDSASNTASATFSLTIDAGLSITTGLTLPGAYVNTAYSTILVASGGTGTGYMWTVASGSSLPSWLSLSAGGVLTGTPTATGTASFTVQVTDSASHTATATFSITVNPSLTITTGAALPAGYVGAAYSSTVAASGGSGTGYTWTVAAGSSLPSWLSLSSAGVLSGTPTAAATSTFTLKVTDSASNTATAAFSLTVDAGVSITTGLTLPAGYVNSAYSSTLAASGGTGSGYSWTVAGGSALPSWLTLSTSGVLSGTPTAAGTSTFALKVTDSASNSATATFSLTVDAGLTITTALTLPAAYVNTAYSATLVASGGSGTGYTWSVASGSSLPSWLNLSSAGVLSGTPTSTATATFALKVVDSASHTATATFSLTVNAALTVSTGATLPTGYVGTAYSSTLAASGGSGTGYAWTIASGSSLPSWLSLSSAGVLSGTPTAAATSTFTLKVTDSASNTATATFSLTVDAALSITTGTTLPAAYVNSAYSATLAAAGGSGAGYTWSVASGSSLPTWLSLSTAGILTGTPTTAATSSFTVKVTDSASNTATATFSLTVNPVLTITTTSPLKTGTINTAYSQQLEATGGTGTGYTWSTNNAGTTSLSTVNLMLTGSGLVTGTPTSAGTATFTAQVTDSANHTASATFYVTITSALVVNTTTLPPATTNTLYSQTLTASGGSGGNVWSVTGTNNLSTFNLSLSSAGVLSGTPTTIGTASFTAQVKDSNNDMATAPLTVAVYAPLALPPPDPSSLGPGTTDESYSGTIVASGGSGNYAFTVTGLSDGLNYASNGGTLTISGTPTSATTVSFGVSVKDTTTGVSVGPYTYTIVVSNPPTLTLPAPNPTSLGAATVNQAYSGTITATGGSGSGYVFTVTGLPSDGLTSAATGGSSTLTISGTPTSATTVSFMVSVRDSLGDTAGPVTYTIAVNNAGAQVTGQISLYNNCSGNNNLPPITVSINTTPVQTTSTDSNGNFSFASVPNGTWTVTPSITTAESVFYPATQSITVSGSPVNTSFSALLGYTVSGTVSYSGANTGQIYLTLNNTSCGQPYTSGTSINSAGAFTIHGVQPGTYTLQAWMDTLGKGATNTADPTGSTSSLTVSTANLTGIDVALTNPSATTLTSAPGLQGASPTNQGAILSYQAITNNSGEEQATSYTLEWSTTNTFSTITGTKSFPATGPNGTNVWFLNGLVNGSVYYFRAQGVAGSSTSPWSSTIGPITIDPPTGANTVSGTVTFPGTATGPLYAGFYDQSTGKVYAEYIQSPVSPQAYTVNLPSGNSYIFVGVIDENKDGVVDVGDISNTNNNQTTTTISGNLSNEDLTLSSSPSIILQTQHNKQINGYGTYTSYNLNFDVDSTTKLPVAVELTSGPNALDPADIGQCTNCGSGGSGFNFQFYLDTDRPNVGDTYSFLVTYSDGTNQTLSASVSSVVDAFVTNLEPQTGESQSVTPTFTWTYPANAASYTYSFQINPYNGGNNIWQVPGNNSSSNGFTDSVTSIVWGTDPTGNTGNTPSISQLVDGTAYNWQMTTYDTNSNTASVQVTYEPGYVNLALPSPNPNSLGSATEGQSYTGTITAIGGEASYDWQVSGLSDNLTWSTNGGNKITISGTPNSTGTVSFQVSVTDEAGHSAGPVTYTINVNSATALTVNTVSLPAGTADVPYSQTLSVSGGLQPYTFSVSSGTFPSWATLDPSTGQISGTPSAAGSSTFTIQVQDSESTPATASQEYTLTINAASGPNNSLLNGTYAFYAGGWLDGTTQANTQRKALVGSFKADGNGNITSGVTDINTESGVSLDQTITGTYTIASNNTGIMTLTIGGSSTPTTMAISVGTITSGVAGAGSLIEYDDNTGIGTAGGARISGEFEKQKTADFTTASLDGNYAFGESGSTCSALNPTCPTTATAYGPISLAGVASFNGAGSITSGEEDAAVGFTQYSAISLSGTYGTPSTTTGRTTGTLNASSVIDSNEQTLWPTGFVYYIISAGHLYVMSTDSHANHAAMVGQLVEQDAASFSSSDFNGNLVLWESSPDSNFVTNFGTTSETSSSEAEFILASVVSSVATINQYKNQNGTYSTSSGNSAGTVSVASNGRVTLSGGGGESPVFYLTAANTGFGTETTESGSHPGLLYFAPQSAGPFSTSTLSNAYFLAAPLTVMETAAETEVITVNSGALGLNGYKSSAGGGLSVESASNTLTVDSSTGLINTPNGLDGIIISPTEWLVVDSTSSNPVIKFLRQ